MLCLPLTDLNFWPHFSREKRYNNRHFLSSVSSLYSLAPYYSQRNAKIIRLKIYENSRLDLCPLQIKLDQSPDKTNEI